MGVNLTATVSYIKNLTTWVFFSFRPQDVVVILRDSPVQKFCAEPLQADETRASGFANLSPLAVPCSPTCDEVPTVAPKAYATATIEK